MYRADGMKKLPVFNFIDVMKHIGSRNRALAVPYNSFRFYSFFVHSVLSYAANIVMETNDLICKQV